MVKIDGEQYKVLADDFEPCKDLDGTFGWKPETKTGQIINATNTYNGYLDNLDILAPFSGDLVSSGKNLFDGVVLPAMVPSNIDGYTTYTIAHNVAGLWNFKGKSNTQYTITIEAKGDIANSGVAILQFLYSDGTNSVYDLGELGGANVWAKRVYTSGINKTIVGFGETYSDPGITYIKKDSLQIEEGTVATAYELFRGLQTIPIGAGNIIGKIKDRIYLNTGKNLLLNSRLVISQANIGNGAILQLAVELIKGQTYTLSYGSTDIIVNPEGWPQFIIWQNTWGNSNVNLFPLELKTNTFTLSTDSGIYVLTIYNHMYSIAGTMTNIQLELGTVATPFEPFNSTDYGHVFKEQNIDGTTVLSTPIVTDLGQVKTFYPQTNLSLTSGAMTATYKVNDLDI